MIQLLLLGLGIFLTYTLDIQRTQSNVLDEAFVPRQSNYNNFIYLTLVLNLITIVGITYFQYI